MSKDPSRWGVGSEASQLSAARSSCRISPPTAEMRMHQPEAWAGPRGGCWQQVAAFKQLVALEVIVRSGMAMEVCLGRSSGGEHGDFVGCHVRRRFHLLKTCKRLQPDLSYSLSLDFPNQGLDSPHLFAECRRLWTLFCMGKKNRIVQKAVSNTKRWHHY